MEDIIAKAFNKEEIEEQHRWLFDFIYDESLNGYLKIRNNSKKIQRFANIQNMRDIYKYEKQFNASYLSRDNMYLSLCTYKDINSGTQENISAIQGFQLDIDYKKVENLKRRSKNDILYILEYDYLNYSVPIPNIIEMGNNIRLIYVFDKPIGATKKSLALINKVISYFSYQLKEVGADKQTVNSMIRLCNSINTKNNSRIEYFLYSEYKYSLLEIQDNWLMPYYKEAKKKLKPLNVKKIRDKVLPLKNPLTLSYNRALDIETIVELREGKCIGYREKIVFVYKNFLLAAGINKDEVNRKVASLNSKFSIPLKKGEIRNAFLERKFLINKNNHMYFFSNKTLISEFLITNSEQKLLRTIIGEEEKTNRRKLRCKEYYNKNRIGLSREEKKEIIISEVKKLKEKGLTQKEIAKELSLGIATIKRYYKYL